MFASLPRAVLLLVVASSIFVSAQYGSQIGCMSDDCNQKLENLLKQYEYATDSLNGCTATCQLECYETIEEALKAKDSFSCPTYDAIYACMSLRRDDWVELLKECPLLKVTSSEAEAEAAEAEAPGPEEAEAEAAEAEAPGPEKAEAEAAEAEAPGPEDAEAEAAEGEGEAATSRRLRQADGEAEAEAAEAEAPATESAEAEAPATESAEAEAAEAEEPATESAEAEAAEAEAPATESAEAEAASAPAPQDASNEGECSSAAAESESESDGLGCWPDFENYDDFQRFVEGAYYSTVFAAPSNTAGIIISVFFWLGLACTGGWLGRTKKN